MHIKYLTVVVFLLIYIQDMILAVPQDLTKSTSATAEGVNSNPIQKQSNDKILKNDERGHEQYEQDEISLYEEPNAKSVKKRSACKKCGKGYGGGYKGKGGGGGCKGGCGRQYYSCNSCGGGYGGGGFSYASASAGSFSYGK